MRRKVASKQKVTVKEDLTCMAAETSDVPEEDMPQNPADSGATGDSVATASKRGKKKLVAKNENDGNSEVVSISNRTTKASRRGKKPTNDDLEHKQIIESQDSKKEISNTEMDDSAANENESNGGMAELDEKQKKQENKVSSNGIEFDSQRNEEIGGVNMDPVSVKAVTKRGRKHIKEVPVSEKDDKPKSSNEESSNVLQGESLEKESVDLETSSVLPNENKDNISNEIENVAAAKRGRKKKESKIPSKETITSASGSVQQGTEKEESNDEINSSSSENDFQVSSHSTGVKNVKGKKGQKTKKAEVPESNVTGKIKRNQATKHIGKMDDILSLEDTATLSGDQTSTRGRKRKMKKEDTETKLDVKQSKHPRQHSDSVPVMKEVRVVLERQKVLETHKDEHLLSGAVLSTEHKGEPKTVPDKKGRVSKRAKGDVQEDLPEKAAKVPKKNDKSSSNKDKILDVSALDFGNKSQSSHGNLWNFKISSWNVNGVRAWLEKDGLSYLLHENPDILCVQETKCSDDKLPDNVKNVDGYHTYWLAGDKDGYSGVGLLTKKDPISVKYGIGVPEHDNEGRIITAEYEQFYLVAAYVPNAGRGLVRLDYRMKWDKDFCKYLEELDQKKPVILCGDLNVAHQEIDLANPKTNKKNAGFTKEEREGFSSLLEKGFVDSFRHFYPDVKGAYTFWTYMMNARAKNVGWRLDYFVISKRLDEKLCDSVIRKDVFGSDHCPITLFLSM